MQIKMTLKFHLTGIIMVTIQISILHAVKVEDQGEQYSITGGAVNLYKHSGNQFGIFSENWG